MAGLLIHNGGVYTNGSKYPYATYQGSKEGLSIWQGENHVWSDYYLGEYNNRGTVTFTPDSTSGGAQGDFSFTGKSLSEEFVEIDPAGGTITCEILAYQTNNWKNIGILGYTYEVGNTSNLLSFTYNGNKPTWLTTYENYSTHVSRIAKVANPNKYDTSKLTFNIVVPANDSSSSSYTYTKLIGFFDETGGVTYMRDNTVRTPKGYNTLPTLKNKSELWLVNYWQKPNINAMYYVNMAFIDPDNVSDAGGQITIGSNAILSSSSNTFENTSADLYLFIEFGVSDGGSTIYWNGNETSAISSQGITTKVPSDIYKYITFTLENPDNDESHYTISATSIVTLGSTNTSYKLVKCELKTDGKNTEQNNTREHIHQQYLLRDLVNVGDSDVAHINYALASWKKDSKSTVTFKIKRAATTDDWNIKIKATLDYESGRMHYKGSTTTTGEVPTFDIDERTDLEEETLGY